MAGFENDVMVSKNLNFDDEGAKPHLGIINAAGKFPIGTGLTSPSIEILGGSITDPTGTLNIGYSSPNITVGVGILPVAHGGTGVNTLTGVLIGNGTSNVTASTVTNHGVVVAGASNTLSTVAPSTSGNVLTSNGTDWTSAAATSGTTTGFYAFASANKTNVTGASVNYTILFDSTTRNDGTCYNTANGTFTVPTGKAGLWAFSAVIFLTTSSAWTGTLVIESFSSNNSQRLHQYIPYTGDGSFGTTATWTCELVATNTMAVVLLDTNAAKDVSVVGGAISGTLATIVSSFSGVYLG